MPDVWVVVACLALFAGVAAGSKSGAANKIRKHFRRRKGIMAEPAMLSPKPASVPDFGGEKLPATKTGGRYKINCRVFRDGEGTLAS
jgi:hypothetical protein